MDILEARGADMAALAKNSFTVPLGKIKTIGTEGPLYVVLHDAGLSAAGEQQIGIQMIETGEVLDYRLSSFLRDPEAA